mgnify:CR=1 FL=1
MKDQIFKPKLLLLGLLSLSALGQSSKDQQEGINKYLVGWHFFGNDYCKINKYINKQ